MHGMHKLIYAPPFLAAFLLAAIDISVANWSLLASCFVFSAVAGVGAAFRKGKRGWGYATTAVLNSGSFGFAVSAAMVHWEMPSLLIVFSCTLVGLGGNMALELTLLWLEERLKRVMLTNDDQRPRG